jgi:leader peptidase (prepilin peptidase)/N-methyltransferase
MGMGDVKLAALVGLFLGLQDFFISLWFAAVLGSGFGFALKSTLRNPKSEITPALGSRPPLPFGSFLAVSSSLVLIFQERVHLLLQSWFTLSS